MKQNRRNTSNQKVESEDKELVGRFLDIQQERAKLEMQRISNQQKRMELDSKLAHKSLDIQEKLFLQQGSEQRKTISTYAIAFGCVLLILLSFIFGCLYLGQEEFAKLFLQAISYVGTTALGYYFGRQKGKENSNGSHPEVIEDAEIID